MTADVDHGLNERQISILEGILKEFSDGIEMVEVFGSRATGKYRPNSDIDLAITGDLSQADVDRLRTLFGESSLPMSVDVVKYDDGLNEAMKSHIDAVRTVLFTGDSLRQAQSAKQG